MASCKEVVVTVGVGRARMASVRVRGLLVAPAESVTVTEIWTVLEAVGVPEIVPEPELRARPEGRLPLVRAQVL